MEIDYPSVLGAFARDLRDEDLLECLLINRGRIGEELVGRTRAIEIWRGLVSSRCFSSTVIEAAWPPGGHRIVGFGSAVFVSRAFALAELSDPSPGVNSRIIASIDSGCSVVLSEAQLRFGNTRDGLDMVILFSSWRQNVLSPEGVSEVSSTMSSRFLERHLGYRFHRLMLETVGAAEAAHNEAMHMWRLVRKFDGPDQVTRSLWVITQEEALSMTGSVGNLLFHPKEPPVFRLRDADQQLLLAAMSGLTDEELSSKLGLSLTGIKKRWISIFERTIDVRPDLFPRLGGLDLNVNDQKRGRQKRHHVLAYVRSHPEELRPFEN